MRKRWPAVSLNDISFQTCNFMAIKLPMDTGRKLNVDKTFKRRTGRLLKVLCAFSLHPVSTELLRDGFFFSNFADNDCKENLLPEYSLLLVLGNHAIS